MTCILTTRSRHRQGYGQIRRDGKTYLEHRWVYCQHNGVSMADIEGQKVRHTCDNPPCINPEHLILGTQQDNVNDMMERGRGVQLRGEQHGCTLLTLEQVKYIRANYKARSRETGAIALAALFGVSRGAVQSVVCRTSWAHVD